MAEEPKEDVRGRVVELLNSAAFLPSEKEKIQALSQVQELVIHRDNTLLDCFFEEIVAFQSDRNADVRKFVVGFIEEACKQEHVMLPRLVPNIKMLLADEAMSVVKRIVQAAAQLHKSALTWVSSAKVTTKEMTLTWEVISDIKTQIINMIDHDNDGVRTQAIKFLEALILMQTYTEPESIVRNGEFCLDSVPLTLKVTKPRKLEDEAKTVLSKLVAFQGSLHISSVNLMTCMSSLTIIARARPQFMVKVIEALEILHANLPPTLTKSQVNSVRKHLKIQLFNLLRHSSALDYKDNIVTILGDLNVTSSEINKAVPAETRRKLRKNKADERVIEPPKKKMRSEKSQVSTKSASSEDKSDLPETAIDITQKWLVERLNIDTVANIVMVTMLNLPDTLPPLFSVAYTPVTAAGSATQVQHVSRLLSSQLTAAQMGPGAEKQNKEEKAQKLKAKEASDSEEEDEVFAPIPRIYSQPTPKPPERTLVPAGLAPRAPALWQKPKVVQLGEITKPLGAPSTFRMQLVLLKRILSIDKSRLYGGALKTRHKILAHFTQLASYEELIELENYILGDLSAHIDLLESWLYASHCNTQDLDQRSKAFSKAFKKETNEYSSFSQLLSHFVTRILDQTPNKERDDLLYRVVLESPHVPESVLDLLLTCGLQGDDVVANVATLLCDLVLWRPVLAPKAISVLCTLSTHNDPKTRELLVDRIVELQKREGICDVLMETASKYTGYLTEALPPPDLFNSHLGWTEEDQKDWQEESVRACLFLMLVLLPHQHQLIHYLARVYVKTVNEAKRTILRYLEGPISSMGMDSPILLKLVETCPKGSETLITRIIHILTEKAPPSEELVCHVRELYNKRVSDVRFLIPVLTGLSQKEVIAVLPKLIKLNPHVVKEVFNRLWGVTLDKGTSPMTPVDLLIALHLIDKCDVKTIIKATALCFAERTIYTAEVLAVVLQHLMEQPTLPTLFMRTVIQTLTHHPKLLSFIMNVLQRLIVKQVWKQKKAWEGFIRCCQRAVPQSFTVLLQLPPPQLADVLSEAEDLQRQLLDHINQLTDTQRAHIPSSIMEIIRNPRVLQPVSNLPVVEESIKMEASN